MARADVGVIGGSGFYDLFRDAVPEMIAVTTPYGEPSSLIALGAVNGRQVAFLPRHGRDHTLPPHRINYRANLWALESLGVTRIVAPCAVGSLRLDMAPGHVVICDQFIDRTKGQRNDTFFDGPEVAHLSAPAPYCEQLRAVAVDACAAAGITAHSGGTIVVIDGPRFATLAESRLHAQSGADIINMTQYPEVVLARELGMCYVALGLVTDYDAGLPGNPDVVPVTQEDVMAVFATNIGRLRDAVLRLVTAVAETRVCRCGPGRPQPLGH